MPDERDLLTPVGLLVILFSEISDDRATLAAWGSLAAKDPSLEALIPRAEPMKVDTRLANLEKSPFPAPPLF